MTLVKRALLPLLLLVAGVLAFQQFSPGTDTRDDHPGQVLLHVDWVSTIAATPACAWSKNSAANADDIQCNMPSSHRDGELFYGQWENVQPAKSGDTFFLSSSGNVTGLNCLIYWKNKFRKIPTRGSECHGFYTLP